MSLLNDASLIVTPNAYKEGKLYSVIPSDGSGDFTFTRATTATRVNSDGLVELVPYNLFTWSQGFENAAWNKQSTSITANNQTAPDGTLTADTMSVSATLSNVNQILALGAGTYTVSIWVKTINVTTSGNLRFSIAIDGVTTPFSFAPTSTWTRFTQTFTASVSVGVVQIVRGFGFVGDVAIWGAQLNEGTLKDYYPTETRLNIPRLDYSLGSCPSILVEPQRTNLALRSEEFDNAAWSKINTIVTENQATAPDGTLTADLLNGNGVLTNHRIEQSFASVPSTKVYSIYAKANDASFMQISTAGTISGWVNFDLSNGTLSNQGTAYVGSIESVGNGWYRCMVYTADAGATSMRISIVSSISAARIESNSLSTSVYLWGAQLEAGAYPTSYIPTTSASVTRNADVVSMTNASAYIGQTEGTIFADAHLTIKNESGSPVTGLITLNNNVSNLNNCILVGIDRPSSGANNKIYVLVIVSGAVVAEIFTSTITEGRYKIALAYKQNDFALYVNGSLVGTDTSGNVPTCSQVLIGSRLNGDTYFLGDKLNSATLYKERLSNAELATLTTI